MDEEEVVTEENDTSEHTIDDVYDLVEQILEKITINL